MPSLDPVVTGEPMCVCGRSAARAHCPSCGKYTHYALTKKSRRAMQDGTFVEFVVRRCRGCAMTYDDWQWRNECNAPESISGRRQKIMEQAHVVDQALHALRPDERTALDKLKSGEASYAERMTALRGLTKNVKRPPAAALSRDDVADIWSEDVDDNKDGDK